MDASIDGLSISSEREKERAKGGWGWEDVGKRNKVQRHGDPSFVIWETSSSFDPKR